MNPKYPVLMFALLALAGCAQVSVKKAETPAAPLAAAHPSEDSKTHKADLPSVELTGQTLYQFLISEVAAQRGQTGLGMEGILGLAKTTRDPRLAKRATELALQARLESRALEAARLWLLLDPADVRARQTVTALLVNSGLLNDARIHLERLLAEEGKSVGNSFLGLHQMLGRQTNKAAVLTLVQELAQPFPDLPEAHFAVAQAAWMVEKDDLTLKEIGEALRLHPDWEMAALFRGQVMQRTSPAQALDDYREFLSANPQALEIRLAYARLLVGEKQYAEARVQFEKLAADNPDNPEVSVALGLLSLQLRDYDKAERYLKQALAEKYRDVNSVRMYLAQLYEERHQYSEAANWFNNVTPGEHFLVAQIRYAAMLAKDNQVAEALRHLHQISVQTNQQRVQVALAEAQILRVTKSFQEAYDLLTKMLDKLPNYPDLLYDRAMAAEKVGRFDVLEQDLRKLIQIKPEYAHAYNALGYSLAERGDRLEEAAKLIDRALKLAPDDPFIMDSMGWVQYRLGAYDKAIDYLRRAYTGQPDPEIAAHLGEVLWVKGSRDEAGKLWQSSLKDNPDNEVLLDAIKKFKP
ncbi:MAG: tetratricopeptide repeat protein [Sulfuricella sp.]|nr:tetratricopeptide repeat protein [Sulfuricella sp.]